MWSFFGCQNTKNLSGTQNLFPGSGGLPAEFSYLEKTRPGESLENGIVERQGPIYLFDHTLVEIKPTSSMDLEIKKFNVYQDIYGELIVLGEIYNKSNTTKTNMAITFDFYDKQKNLIKSIKEKAYADYFLPKTELPFYLVYDERTRYIDISEIKIGVNYNNHNKGIEGAVVVTEEKIFYDNDIMSIKGNIFNISSNDIEKIKLIATFYNEKGQVVFIRECYIQTDKLLSWQKQDFEVNILFDEYIKPFTAYNFGVFFRDSLKV